MMIVLTLISMAAIFVIAGFFAKRSGRGRKTSAEREKQIADLLASAHAEARDRQRGDDVLPALVTNTSKTGSAKRISPRLLSDGELRLYTLLVEAMPALLVFPSIDFPQRSGERGQGTSDHNEIDFVVCRAGDSSIVAAIKLHGSLRQSEERHQIRFDAVDIPLVTLNAVDLPDVVSLRKMIAPHVLGRQSNT